MARAKDPTEPIRTKAAAFPDVIEGTSCNQTSFKTGKTAFFYCGPGAKGQGFKAMFKLERSLPQAEKLAANEPDRFGAGSGGWVSARFTPEKPLAKTIWEKWLKESYELACGSGTKGKQKTAKKVTKKKVTKQR